jgi:hypothetical protein
MRTISLIIDYTHLFRYDIGMRKSTITEQTDEAGKFETEQFDCESPKSIVICSHGNGVRRWDGEEFFYNVAERYKDRAFFLVDQTKVIEDGCELIDLRLMIARVQGLISEATEKYPGVPITVLGHSMGCGVASLLNIDDVSRMILIAPAGGDVLKLMVQRYGQSIVKGSLIKTSDGLNKLLSKEYVNSIGGVIWEQKYEKLLKNFSEVYAYEAGDDDIVTEERRAPLRPMPFASYKIINGATHNFHGEALEKLYKEIDELI